MFPKGAKLVTLKRNKTIDCTIVKFISESNQIPIVEKITTKLNEPINQQDVLDRLQKIS